MRNGTGDSTTSAGSESTAPVTGLVIAGGEDEGSVLSHMASSCLTDPGGAVALVNSSGVPRCCLTCRSSIVLSVTAEDGAILTEWCFHECDKVL